MKNTAFKECFPELLSESLKNDAPVEISCKGELVKWSVSPEGCSAESGCGLSARVILTPHPEHDAMTVRTVLYNRGDVSLRDISVQPLLLRFEIDPSELMPRVRHMSGAWHYDNCYPPRAFRVSEEAFMGYDHSKPVVIGGKNACIHSPVMQFALSKDGMLHGIYFGFEWSGEWELSAGWEENSFSGSPKPPDFIVRGSIELGDLEIQPRGTLELPALHIGWFEGRDWQHADNCQRAYLRECVSASLKGSRILPVSYDHWFGLYENFDVECLMKQAKRAAELGCEYFCVDAAWYKTSNSFISGIGNWDTPDPDRFPYGEGSMLRLSEYVRGLGMGFGIWHLIQQAQPGSDAIRTDPSLFRENVAENDVMPGIGYSLRLETPEGVEYAKKQLSDMVKRWGVTWMRFESIPENGLVYNNGYNAVIDHLRREFPALYIEDCNGGGQRLDINMVSRTDGNWLSDHTSDPEVCRFMQTGALRFWPVHFLNMGITAFKGRAGQTAKEHQALSRMAGVLSFTGAISEWTQEQTDVMRKCVEIYKSIRSYKEQPVLFPLPQPRCVEDWDSVVFGDGSGERQLLFVFRTEGEDSSAFSVPGRGEWRKLMGEGAELVCTEERVSVTMPRRSSALWIR